MRYAVSNIAWRPEQRVTAYRLMRETGFTGLEIAPGLFLPEADDPFDPSEKFARAALDEAKDFDVQVVSMQSLLFGRTDAKLFGNNRERRAFVEGLEASITLAERLGIGNLVFGSPTQRIVPEGLSWDEALQESGEVFRALAEKAKANSTVIAIEPNPAEYGTNFLTNLAETTAFVRQVNHPALRLNLDLGALIMNGELGHFRFADHSDLVSHVHVSAPMLAPAPIDTGMARAIHDRIGCHWNGWLSIEMRQVEGDDKLATLKQCMRRLVTGKVAAS